MFVSHHTLKWTRTCRSHGRHPHAHTAHFLLNRHNNGRTGRQILNMMLMQAGYEPIAIRHDAGSTYAGRLEQWQAYGNPVPLACMVADCVVREQCRIGKIVSDIRRGHPIAGHARGIRE